MKKDFAGLMFAVVIPFFQSFITGIFVWFFAYPLVVIFIKNYDSKMVAWGIAGLVGFVQWIYLRGRWQLALEQILSIDLNFDGQIGVVKKGQDSSDFTVNLDPGIDSDISHKLAVGEPVRAWVNEGNKTKIVDFQLDNFRLLELAQQLLVSKSFSYAAFAGVGKLLSRSEFESLREELVRRGILHRNSDGTCTLSRVGEAVLKEMIGQQAPAATHQ